MSEYITKPYEDKEQSTNKFLVCPKSEKDFSIICVDKSEAHKLTLSLLLGTTPSPIQAPEIYNFLHENGSIKFYTAKPIALGLDDDEKAAEEVSGCCQSGCDGCPDYKG